MAYKFSVGKYKHSGSLVSADSLTVTSGDVSLPAGVINESELSASSVTVSKLATDAVETVKIKDLNVTTGKLADAAVTNGKIAAGAVQSGSIAAGAIVDGHIAASTITNAKLANTGSVLGTTAVVLGATVPTISGLTALSASAISGGVVVGDGAGMTNLSASQLNNFTADVRAQISVSDSTELDMSYAAGAISAVILANSVSSSKFEPVSFSGSVQHKMNAYLTGGAGLSYSNGTFDIGGDGALKVAADSVYVSSSIAGLGLSFTSGTASDSVRELNVNTTGALAIKVDDLAISSSIAGFGLIADAPGGAVKALSVVYGSGSNTAVQGNTPFTASAGNGLTGDFSGLLGSGPSFTFAVGAGNGIEVAADSVAVKLSGGVGNQALVVNADGLDLKQTIAGNRIFTGDVTINNLNVTGTMTTINTTNLEVKDARILIASGSSAFTASQGFDFGGYAQLLTAEINIDGTAGNEQVLSSSLSLVAPAVSANTFYGSFVGTSVEGVQTMSSASPITKSIVLANASSSAYTATLPDASAWTGKIIKVKRTDKNEANILTVAASGSQKIDADYASVDLDSPYAALMLASDGTGWYVF